ncbi:alpha/beta fold hydrolase [Rhizobium leguminosarum bv. viciae]|uniref:Alpha/beta fold hydrolase n=1 Tax=Rhizobium leguminosarum bv. viciae TaxID=387 RepID=A0A8I2H3E4_RHILV|nr:MULTISPECIES: alpha/beta hydrolase [Rhizobium]MBY3081066.1 alpha/beta hydrolase [Rhizobium laguerreae]MBY3114966.1 alpha/beta hydrolase [Rhizobium laguerreae]MBY3279848.1 alpha/beta hydrolase [Rhizobium laguerreae]MBY3422471.1 alpha/beta hydrolase [Rhizobium laguerreae]MBY3473383.1 alpha/beta hydrolase [Rhizobium laguerreae]
MNKSRPLRATLGLFVSLVMCVLSSIASAAEKNYTVKSSDGVIISVQETGNPDGQPIVFAHGLLGSHINWDKQTGSPGLQKYRMITYDMRGHGQSGKPDDVDAYQDGRRWADDLSAVLKSSDAKTPLLVGWSLGGVVLSNYLAAYGDAGIGGFVYVDGVIELTQPLITAHPQVYAGLASDDLRTHLDAVRAFLALCFETQPDTATFERLLSNAAMASWIMTRATPSMTVSAVEGLPKANVPVLLLYGAKDNLVNTQPSISRAKELNPAIKTKVYADSGHAPFLEEAARFNHDLSDFADFVSQAK